MSTVADQVVFVSGAANGIGRALCEGCAADGAHIVGVDVDAAGLAETERLVGDDRLHVFRVCDVGDADAVYSCVADAERAVGPVRLLVNNAAVWNDTTLLGGTFEQQTAAFARAVGSIAFGSFNCAAAVAPAMRGAGGGAIVNLITEHIRMHRLITGYPATGYDAAKFAQWRLTESWAVELKDARIRVNGLAFGATDTPMLRAVSVPIAEAGMRATDIVDAVRIIVGHGPDGPTGHVWDIGFTGMSRTESLAQIAALRALATSSAIST